MSSNRSNAHTLLHRRKRNPNTYGGTASLLSLVLGVCFTGIWLSFFLYVSMYSSRVQQWHPVGPAVSVASVTITDGASRTLLKKDVSVHDHLRKVPSQPIQRQPVGNVALNSSKQSQHPSLEQKQDRTPASTIAFPPKFPVMMRNNTLSTTILEMCERTLWHTLETTTIVLPEGDSFIHTGDINDL